MGGGSRAGVPLALVAMAVCQPLGPVPGPFGYTAFLQSRMTASMGPAHLRWPDAYACWYLGHRGAHRLEVAGGRSGAPVGAGA